MQIFHLVPNMNYGGLQKVVQLLAQRQASAGHDVTIGCWTHQSGNHPEAEAELEASGVRIVYLLRGPAGQFWHGRKISFNRLRTYLGKGKADILHVHNPFEYYLYGALAARAAGWTKSINTIHLTAMFDHAELGRRRRAEFWLATMLIDALVSVCDEVDEYLRRRFWLPGKKMLVVENGIDLTPYLAVPDRVLREELVFGFTGRMAQEKNHHVLIDAFALALRTHPNIRLRILGSGRLEPELKEQVQKLGLGGVIEFCGFGNDVAGFLSTLDIYILPSKFEAHPLSLIEAIASGLPVVATSVGGVAKIVESTGAGWLCEPNSPEALAAAIDQAIASPDRGERTRRARQLVADLYSADLMAAGHEAVYRKLLE